MERIIIYGVYLKKDNFYFGYFGKKEDAVNEMKIQAKHLFPNTVYFYNKERSIIEGGDGEVLISMHPILVR